jgi:hypothetical protein
MIVAAKLPATAYSEGLASACCGQLKSMWSDEHSITHGEVEVTKQSFLRSVDAI